jgi:hypothetical protein
VPKAGALCIVGFLYNDSNRRVYLGSYFRDHGNRSLPVGRNRSDVGPAPLSDTYEPIEPQNASLNAQFQGKLTASEALTRGAYERAVAQDKTHKDGAEGYQADLVQPKDAGVAQYDSQSYVLTTPGRHSIIMQDNPATGRLRLKTAAGHQVILDDANERIYVSTAAGASWIELDQDGRIHAYAADSFSLSSGGSINLSAVKSVNIQAGEGVNIQAGKSLLMAGCESTHLSGKGVNIESTAGLNILAADDLIQTGSNIHLNGPSADGATCPTVPDTVPAHEPWTRAGSKGSRNKNWRA